MNIGIVTTWFERGAAYVSKAYLDALHEEHSVFIFARGGESRAIDDPYWDKPNVTWGKQHKDNWFRIDWRQFKQWVRQNDIDIVVFNEQQDWEIIVDCTKLDIITVAYVDYYTRRTIPFFQLYDSVICHTKRHFSVFENHFQPHYIPWGTDLELYRPVIKREETDVIFFHSAGMGGINLRKGTDLLVRAFSSIEATGAKLIIHSQKPLHTFQEVAQVIAAHPRITFIHETVAPPGLYHLADVYVYPSRLDGLGLTIMEALASGLPVITTDSPPMSEFVTDQVTGKLVKVEYHLSRDDGYFWAESICSIKSLAESMLFFVNNRQQLPRYQNAARRYAEQELDWSRNSKLLRRVFSGLTKNPHKDVFLQRNKAQVLGYTFSRRENGNRIRTRLARKLWRRLHGLD